MDDHGVFGILIGVAFVVGFSQGHRIKCKYTEDNCLPVIAIGEDK